MNFCSIPLLFHVLSPFFFLWFCPPFLCGSSFTNCGSGSINGSALWKQFVLRSKGRGGDALTAERLSPAVELPRPFQRCFFFFSFLISLQLERHLDPNFHSNPAATVDEPLPAVCELHHDASPVLDLQNDCAAQAGLPYLGELHEDPSEVVPLTDIWVVVDASTAAPWTDFEGVADVDNLPDFEDLSLLPEF